MHVVAEEEEIHPQLIVVGGTSRVEGHHAAHCRAASRVATGEVGPRVVPVGPVDGHPVRSRKWARQTDWHRYGIGREGQREITKLASRPAVGHDHVASCRHVGRELMAIKDAPVVRVDNDPVMGTAFRQPQHDLPAKAENGVNIEPDEACQNRRIEWCAAEDDVSLGVIARRVD